MALAKTSPRRAQHPVLESVRIVTWLLPDCFSFSFSFPPDHFLLFARSLLPLACCTCALKRLVGASNCTSASLGRGEEGIVQYLITAPPSHILPLQQAPLPPPILLAPCTQPTCGVPCGPPAYSCQLLCRGAGGKKRRKKELQKFTFWVYP